MGLALYRAILRETPHVPLPPDVVAAWQPLDDPVGHLVRRAFRRNLNDTSPRLVYPALAAGYRALEMLRDAQSPTTTTTTINTTTITTTTAEPTSTPSTSASASASSHASAHASILRLLASHQLKRRRSLTAKETHPPYSRNPQPWSAQSAPREGTLPLLVRVPLPASQWSSSPSSIDYRYETPIRPRPASALGGSGRRHVPHMDMAGDFPFLRTTKPQPPLLSRILTQKIRRRTRRVETARTIADDDMPLAELEDEWERTVEGLLEGEHGDGMSRRRFGDYDDDDCRGGGGGGGGGGGDYKRRNRGPKSWGGGDDEHNTYSATLWRHGVVYIQHALTREHEDLLARGRALRELVIQERELAEKEKEERKAERRRRWEEHMKAGAANDGGGGGSGSDGSFESAFPPAG